MDEAKNKNEHNNDNNNYCIRNVPFDEKETVPSIKEKEKTHDLIKTKKKMKGNFFINIFNLYSSDENTSGEEKKNSSQEFIEYDIQNKTNVLSSKKYIDFIYKNDNSFKKYIKDNEHLFRHVKKKSIAFFPMRKNNGIKDCFFIINTNYEEDDEKYYPKDYHDEKNDVRYNNNNCDYDNYRSYKLFHFSLKNKKNHNKRYVIKYTRKEEKKTNYIQILLIQKKKKIIH